VDDIGTASLLVFFSSSCFATAVWRQLWPGAPPLQPHVRRVHPALLTVVNGLFAVVSVAAWVIRELIHYRDRRVHPKPILQNEAFLTASNCSK
jgi:hypothetical protein